MPHLYRSSRDLVCASYSEGTLSPSRSSQFRDGGTIPSMSNCSSVPKFKMDYHFRVKALVKAKSEPGLWLRDIPDPTIGINDVLIRVRRTGICGTDVHIYDWDEWARKTITVPMAIGHE